MSNFVIYGEGGSAAEKYAKDNGFAFNAPGSLEDISSASVTLDKTSYIYDGKAKTPSVTVKLNGKYFASYVQEGERVTKGQKVLSFETDKVKAEGYETDVMVVITNTDQYLDIFPNTKLTEATPEDELLRIIV